MCGASLIMARLNISLLVFHVGSMMRRTMKENEIGLLRCKIATCTKQPIVAAMHRIVSILLAKGECFMAGATLCGGGQEAAYSLYCDDRRARTVDMGPISIQGMEMLCMRSALLVTILTSMHAVMQRTMARRSPQRRMLLTWRQ